MAELKAAQSIDEIRAVVRAARREAKSIGFVPTMGALHQGHAALIKRAAAECQHVVVSIFVNPTQFGPNEDLAAYPRTPDEDAQVIYDAGGSSVFFPTVEMMYPRGYRTYVDVEGLTEHLCGASRPNHFRGVTTIVAKLFNIVAPDKAFFGRKDFQQATVLRRMARDLNMPVEVVVCPTVRETDGLALSSRNRYLNESQRAQALCLVGALDAARKAYAKGERTSAELKRIARGIIELQPDARVDYVEVVDAESVQPVDHASDDSVMALAVFMGTARLIDNASMIGER